jgi:hypothetical protein
MPPRGLGILCRRNGRRQAAAMSARGRWTWGLVGLAMGLAAADTGLWWFATGQLADGLDGWAATARADGWTVSYPAPTRRGWPLKATLAVPEMTLAGAAAWRAAAVELTLSPAEPRRLRVTVGGPQTVSLPGQAAVDVTARSFDLSIPLDDPGVVDLAAEGVRAALPGGALEVGRLTAHAANRPAAGRGQEALAFTGAAEAVALPPPPDGRSWALGSRLASVSIDAGLTGPVPPPGPPRVRASQWRDGGGSAQLRRLALGWGPLGLAASASLRLDARLQPSGSGEIRAVGYDAALDALVASGAMPARAGMVAKGVMALMARAPEGGGAAQVELPITLNDGTLTAGRFPLLRLPEFVWP